MIFAQIPLDEIFENDRAGSALLPGLGHVYTHKVDTFGILRWKSIFLKVPVAVARKTHNEITRNSFHREIEVHFLTDTDFV